MDRQNTNEGQDTAEPERSGETVKPGEGGGGHRPTEEERRAGAGGVAERGAAAARAASRKPRPADPSSWRGQEVADAPDSQAEEDADVAAGRAPGHGAGEGFDPSETAEPVHLSPEEERQTQELKRQAAAEDHEVDKAEGRGTAPKNL